MKTDFTWDDLHFRLTPTRDQEGSRRFFLRDDSGKVLVILRASRYHEDLYDSSASLASPCCGDIGGEIYDAWDIERTFCSECEEDYSTLSHLQAHVFLADCGEPLLPADEMRKRVEEWLAFLFPTLDPLLGFLIAQDLLKWWDEILNEALDELREETLLSTQDFFDEVL